MTGMARRPREEHSPGVYHVYARGNDRQRIFLTDADRRLYLALLGKVTTVRRWRTMAFCLMDNHLHFLVETVSPNLGAGMGRLHGSYAQDYNRRHGRTGHLFERRYNAVPIASDAQLQMVARYTAVNPVEAGLCDRPEAWPWSQKDERPGTCPGLSGNDNGVQPTPLGDWERIHSRRVSSPTRA